MLDKNYTPSDCEIATYQAWEKSNIFACDPTSSKTPYCIMIPPPNVTGNLHMGHALTFTIQDILIRYNRMKGCDVLWQPGTDHAGIATQMVVERLLAKDKVSRHDLGREKFLEKVWEWKAQSGGQITKQLRRLGASLDWERERFTMDEGLSKAVRKVFVQLYNEGLIYRDKRLVNWDPKLQTAISDLEVEQRETVGKMWYFKYPIENTKDRFITIATTRPETLLGDTAVAVSQDDERYQDLIGKNCVLPVVNRLIPIIADEHADPTKGTGAVKITPAHDFNDFEVGKRHNLPMINILDIEGRLNENTPLSYQGLTCAEAREKIVQEIKELGLFVEEKDNPMTIPYGDRSNVVIEPWLTDQWFVDAQKLSVDAIKVVEEGRLQFVPKVWEKTYFEWMRHIQPWCISRQLWWGHQIPVWFGEDGHFFVAETVEEARAQALKHYGKTVDLVQDPDVLDTWFSSGLWAFSTLGWPETTAELKKYYPTDVLVTGFDIIFFWVARMVMMSMHFMKDVPFRTVYIHALVRDEKGQKMSKSKGNVVDPLVIADKYGIDALRFTLASMAAQGRDVLMSESRIEGYRNFVTKLWNVARFCEMNECRTVQGFDPKSVQEPINKWIVSKLASTAQKVTQGIEEYKFNESANVIYQFTWGNFCDWYVEFAKPLFYGENESLKAETRATCAWVLDNILILLHPFMPFVTEELWGKTSDSRESKLISTPWVDLHHLHASDSETDLDWVIDLVTAIRSLRSEMNVAPALKIRMLLRDASLVEQERLVKFETIIKTLARLDTLGLSVSQEDISGSAQAVFGSASILLPLSGMIDVVKETERLNKEKDKLEKEILGLQTRLGNQDFVAKAPASVIEGQQSRLVEAQNAVVKIVESLDRLKQI